MKCYPLLGSNSILKSVNWTKPSSHTKQRKTHKIPLCEDAIELLTHIKSTSTSDYVFTGHKDCLTDVKKTWKTACETANLMDARIHDIRHSFASMLVSSGEGLPMIGKLLGHTQAQTTLRYTHLYDNPQREALEKVSKLISIKGK